MKNLKKEFFVFLSFFISVLQAQKKKQQRNNYVNLMLLKKM